MPLKRAMLSMMCSLCCPGSVRWSAGGRLACLPPCREVAVLTQQCENRAILQRSNFAGLQRATVAGVAVLGDKRPRVCGFSDLAPARVRFTESSLCDVVAANC